METTPTESPKPKGKKPKGKRGAVKNGNALPVPAKRGRPPRVPYSDELAEKLFERLRNGETLKAICREKGMPRAALVRQWAMEDAEFGDKYQRARELGCHAMADEIIDLADNKTTESGAVARDRLKIESRRWLLARILPSVFGDRVEAQIKGGLVVVKLDAEDLAL